MARRHGVRRQRPGSLVLARQAGSLEPTYQEDMHGRPAALGNRRGEHIIGRRGTTSRGQAVPATLGYSKNDHEHAEGAVSGCPGSGRPGKSGASASPTETPQAGDTASDPHRNPTDETARSGTRASSAGVPGLHGDRGASISRCQEGQQISVDRLRPRGGHAVREAPVGLLG
jgi:hypothetical protein